MFSIDEMIRDEELKRHMCGGTGERTQLPTSQTDRWPVVFTDVYRGMNLPLYSTISV
jgi:hypothetical protein